MRIIVTGGTGVIGRRLVNHLHRTGDHEIIVLTRNTLDKERLFPSAIRLQTWDAISPQGWDHLIDTDTVIINLAGENVANWRWTLTHKRIVLQSRLDAARAVTQAIEASPVKPRALLQASAVGYYGSRGDLSIGEITSSGEGWRAEVCKLWEMESAPVEAAGVRRVLLRIGVVLERGGSGLLAPTLLANRLFAARLGDGQQWIPWVHNEDVARSIAHIIDTPAIRGPVNVVAPEPLTNADYMRTIARVRRWPGFIPVPEWALRVTLGEMATTVLDSQRVYPPLLLECGYQFAFPDLTSALKDLL